MSDRFPISPAGLEVCKEVILEWKVTHFPEQDFDEQITILASRVNSWMAGTSVEAGVKDVMTTVVRGEDSAAKIEALGVKLGRRLSAEGLLIGSPKRTSSLG